MSAEQKVNSLRKPVTRREFMKGAAQLAAGSLAAAALPLPVASAAAVPNSEQTPQLEQQPPLEIDFENLPYHPEYLYRLTPLPLEGDFALAEKLGTALYNDKIILATGKDRNILQTIYNPQNHRPEQGNLPLQVSFDIGKVKPIDQSRYLITDHSNKALYLVNESDERLLHRTKLTHSLVDFFNSNNQVIFNDQSIFKNRLNALNLDTNELTLLFNTEGNDQTILGLGLSNPDNETGFVYALTANTFIDEPTVIRCFNYSNNQWQELNQLPEYDPIDSMSRIQIAVDPTNPLVAEKNWEVSGRYRFAFIDQDQNRILLPVFLINRVNAREDLIGILQTDSNKVSIFTRFSQTHEGIIKIRYVTHQATYDPTQPSQDPIQLEPSNVEHFALSDMWRSSGSFVPESGKMQINPKSHSKFPNIIGPFQMQENGMFQNGIISPRNENEVYMPNISR